MSTEFVPSPPMHGFQSARVRYYVNPLNPAHVFAWDTLASDPHDWEVSLPGATRSPLWFYHQRHGIWVKYLFVSSPTTPGDWFRTNPQLGGEARLRADVRRAREDEWKGSPCGYQSEGVRRERTANEEQWGAKRKAPAEWEVHKVGTGDSPPRICVQFGVPLEKLVLANPE